MLLPSIDKLLTIVDSKFTLVTIISRRSREITKTGYSQINHKDLKSVTSLGKALEEVAEGLILVK
ncbi:MAG: DNA-directed RNA polymerase subunit omega [Bacilli bacterium]|jgi:DNA-directed RNA polymerase subunit omega|nr:DNA-directed RNA polymerase subunit omega [Mollicutes bacterium]